MVAAVPKRRDFNLTPKPSFREELFIREEGFNVCAMVYIRWCDLDVIQQLNVKFPFSLRVGERRG